MKKGFTLIELIFVIVIIGVLAAVAVPKFTNLKQNADAASVIKVAKDAYASIPSAFVNKVDLEGDVNGSAVTITDLITVSGKGWTVEDTNASYSDGTNTILTLVLNRDDRNVTLDINCSQFSDTKTQSKCNSKLGGDSISEVLGF